jgi:hypothetical protein
LTKLRDSRFTLAALISIDVSAGKCKFMCSLREFEMMYLLDSWFTLFAESQLTKLRDCQFALAAWISIDASMREQVNANLCVLCVNLNAAPRGFLVHALCVNLN